MNKNQTDVVISSLISDVLHQLILIIRFIRYESDINDQLIVQVAGFRFVISIQEQRNDVQEINENN